jgi:hypothetical protein
LKDLYSARSPVLFDSLNFIPPPRFLTLGPLREFPAPPVINGTIGPKGRWREKFPDKGYGYYENTMILTWIFLKHLFSRGRHLPVTAERL